VIKVGDIFHTRFNGDIQVVDYISCSKILIKFINTGNTKFAEAGNIRKGTVKSNYIESIYETGFLGDGYYNWSKNKDAYIVWHLMLDRCYGSVPKAYKDCYVNYYWHNFQNFAPWYYDNYKIDYHLDKDLVVFENKEYSPSKCIFIPREINSFFHIKESNNILGVSFRDNSIITRIDGSFHNNIISAQDHYWKIKKNKMNILINKYPEFEEIMNSYFDKFYNKHYQVGVL